jgi:hypothetical protein
MNRDEAIATANDVFARPIKSASLWETAIELVKSQRKTCIKNVRCVRRDLHHGACETKAQS